MSDLVSIIMPVYNAAFFLPETLLSVSNQTYEHWQLVIVDDGSTDESQNICARFKNDHQQKCIILQSNKKQSGAGVCRNIGLQKCTGSFVIFLDSDDLLESFCLEQRVKAIEKNDLVIFKQYILTDNKKNNLKIFNGAVNNGKDAVDAFMRMEAPWQTMAGIWGKKALQILNGFDESLVFMEDPDLHLRALLNKELNIIFRYDLPADNYYRINNMETEKAFSFYKNSILSRINFMDKLIRLTENASLIERKRNVENIKKGYFSFLRNFVMSRFNDFKDDIIQLNKQLNAANVFSTSDKLKLKFLFSVYASNSLIVKKMRLKGIAYKLIK